LVDPFVPVEQQAVPPVEKPVEILVFAQAVLRDAAQAESLVAVLAVQ
jgi:hypothetical protein